MTYSQAMARIIDAAVLEWARDTKQADLRTALDTILAREGDNAIHRALTLKW